MDDQHKRAHHFTAVGASYLNLNPFASSKFCSAALAIPHDATNSASDFTISPQYDLAHKRGRKPKNARSKRAMQAREPKEVEDPRTAVFVKGTHVGETVNGVMKELVRLYLFCVLLFSPQDNVLDRDRWR